MEWPFEPGETITLVVLYTTAILAWAELKIGMTNTKSRIGDLEDLLKDLKASQVKQELADQALQQVKDVLEDVKHELKNQRTSMLQMERLLGRLEAKVGIE